VPESTSSIDQSRSSRKLAGLSSTTLAGKLPDGWGEGEGGDGDGDTTQDLGVLRAAAVLRDCPGE
jgi:hypothetical protein